MKSVKALVIAGVMLLSSASISNAASNEEVDQIALNSIKKDKHSVQMEWNNVPNSSKYLVTNEDQVVFRGKGNSFSHKGLIPGQALNYYVTALDKNNKVISTTNIVTTTVSENEQELLNLDINATTKRVKLNWNDLPNITSYDIYKNGVMIDTVKQSKYTDKSISGESGDYKIVAKAPDVEVYNPLEGKSEKAEGKSYEIDVPVKYVNDIIGESEETFTKSLALASLPLGTTIRHRTFIKTDKFGTTDGYCYAGDGRGFSSTAGTHRTQLGISVDWYEKSYSVSRDTDSTKRYKKNSDGSCSSTLIDTKTASTSGMSVTQPSVSASEAFFHVVHSVGMPFYFDAPPNIDYTYDLTIYRSGVTAISGSHDKFPWHEIYRSDDGTWKTLYTFDASPYNLSYLWPAKPNQSFSLRK